jgi:4-hydroxy-tetrahydrodipicolinate reductase
MSIILHASRFTLPREVNILLLGYGKMGRTIEQTAIERGHTIAGRIDLHNRADLDALTDVDVAIEFSSPESAVDNLLTCFERGWPVVCGTTGWLGRREEVENQCKVTAGGFFYASNYSIGVNLFFKLNRTLARFMHNHPSYRVSMTEIHHTEKKDAPSGTAITLAEAIRKEGVGQTEATETGLIDIESIREGTVPGTHTVRYESDTDRIEIGHVAHSRQGFALGAVIAAEWMVGRQGVFDMDDLLDL